MGPKDEDRLANIVDPDQTAPLVPKCLLMPVCPKNLGSLRYFWQCIFSGTRETCRADETQGITLLPGS